MDFPFSLVLVAIGAIGCFWCIARPLFQLVLRMGQKPAVVEKCRYCGSTRIGRFCGRCGRRLIARRPGESAGRYPRACDVRWGTIYGPPGEEKRLGFFVV